jgi:hypothetical protein
VVGVQAHEARVVGGHHVGHLRQGDRPGHRVADTGSGEVLGPSEEICTMPSLSASANPRSAALRVWVEVTLTAG